MLLLASPLQPLSMSSIGTMEDSDFNDLFFPAVTLMALWCWCKGLGPRQLPWPRVKLPNQLLDVNLQGCNSICPWYLGSQNIYKEFHVWVYPTNKQVTGQHGWYQLQHLSFEKSFREFLGWKNFGLKKTFWSKNFWEQKKF